MTKQILFKKVSAFLGRNGRFKSTGLNVYESVISGDICIVPITSKGLVGRSMIAVPKENVQDLIKTLKDLL